MSFHVFMCSQKSLPSKHDIPYFICTGSLAIKPPRQKQLRKNAWQPQTPMREVCTRICSFVTGQANIPIVKIFTASGTLRFLKAFVRKNRDARLLRAGAATLGLHVFTFNVRMSTPVSKVFDWYQFRPLFSTIGLAISFRSFFQRWGSSQQLHIMLITVAASETRFNHW